MPVRSTRIRWFKWLGKGLLAVLLVLALLIALIHTPPAQRFIGRQLSHYLSTRTGGSIAIGRLSFSFGGHISIRDLSVKDPAQALVLSAGKIDVRFTLIKLLTGNLQVDDVYLRDVEGRLTEDSTGMNIGFLLDAFGGDTQESDAGSPMSVLCSRILLEQIKFTYSSATAGMSIQTSLGRFASHDIRFSTQPNLLSASTVQLDQAIASILLTGAPQPLPDTTVTSGKLTFQPDFNLGMAIEIGRVDVTASEFAFHRNSVIESPAFDPDHITLERIGIHVSDIRINSESFGAGVDGITLKMPGLDTIHARANLKMTPMQATLGDLSLTTGDNDLHANIEAWYDDATKETQDLPDARITARARVWPTDLAYFLGDEIMSHIRYWSATDVALDGEYLGGEAVVKHLAVSTSGSRLQATGRVRNVTEPDQLNWHNLVVDASVGADIRQSLKPYLTDLRLPPAIRLNLRSNGNLNRIDLDGNIATSWGDVRANGLVIPAGQRITLDVNVTGDKLLLGNWLDNSDIGALDLSVVANGDVGKPQDLAIEGLVGSVVLRGQTVRDITFNSRLLNDSVSLIAEIRDSLYRARLTGGIAFGGPLRVNAEIHPDHFHAGRLLGTDSTLVLTGEFSASLRMPTDTLQAQITGTSLAVTRQSTTYRLDSLSAAALIAPDTSRITYYADDADVSLVTNFDLRTVSDLIGDWQTFLTDTTTSQLPAKDRLLDLQATITDPGLFSLLEIPIDSLSGLEVKGRVDEQAKVLNLYASTGPFMAYGASLDTLSASLVTDGDTIAGKLTAANVSYQSRPIGQLDLSLAKTGNETNAGLKINRDTLSAVDLKTRIRHTQEGLLIYPQILHAFGYDYAFNPDNPIRYSNDTVAFADFRVTHDDMSIGLDGDLNAFAIDLHHLRMTTLNTILFQDSLVIESGSLSGRMEYARKLGLDLDARIDSLVLYNSDPFSITATASTEDSQIPFQLHVANAANRLDAGGRYEMSDESLVAEVSFDFENAELLQRLLPDVIAELEGSIRGNANVSGPVRTPAVDGYLRFRDANLTLRNPPFTFNIPDDSIRLTGAGFSLSNFTIYDKRQFPLIVNGALTTPDYQTFEYTLNIKTDQYTLIDNAASTRDPLSGLLVIAADVQLDGDGKDTYINAGITIKDSTFLTYLLADDEHELLKSEGIVEFVEPEALADTTAIAESTSYYDSLVASLPKFNLNSKVTIEQNAKLRLITNATSGDFFEASGAANLDLGFDQTGTIKLTGDYTVTEGVYRLSFYDLVRKDFNLVKGSSINWHGSPQNGDLDIKAVHTIQSNSIGLIGHEVGENEQSIYKRSLDYEVGVNIGGTIEKPEVTFSLDLPKQDKTSYPALANKLERLKQPEYQSELNKQVFGLLVLGGFLPDASTSNVNENVVAATALSNSVNSLLAAQLNRFAGQYIKGVDIDVGLQSYSDYSTPGGKTRTAMDFRVTKTIMNDRLSFEIGGDFDINKDQSGAKTGTDNYRGDVAIIYDLTGNGDKQLKLFNNETYDIIYQEIRNTGISLIFIREFNKGELRKARKK